MRTKPTKRMKSEALVAAASTSVIRSAIATGLGKSYGGDRNVYTALGYKQALSYTDYALKYARQDIAKRIITAYPDATWRGIPEVYETEKGEETTAFEKAWQELERDIDVWHYFTRVDKLCGIGNYAVLFLGFSDGVEPVEPVTFNPNTKLMYPQPYSSENAKVKTYVADPTDPRYGLPETYELNIGSVVKDSSKSQPGGKLIAHWSRCVHVAEDLLEDNVNGTPRLECVYNRLQNLELVVGGGAEMWWRSALPGIALEMEGTAKIADEDALNEEIEEYVHNLRRVLRLQGMKANNLAPTIAQPKEHVDVIMQMISGATGIPVRILTGSERGELASTQDRENWSDRVAERRTDFAEPMVVRQFVKRLQEAGALPPLAAKDATVKVDWPAENVQTEKEKAEISELRTKAIKAYVESGGEMLVPPMMFLTDFLGMTQEEAEEAMGEVDELMKIEEQEAKEAEAKAKEEADVAAKAALDLAKAAGKAPVPPVVAKKKKAKKKGATA